MSGINENPITTRLQAEQWAKFTLMRAPALTYFAQKVNLPKISFEAPIAPNMFGNIPYGGDHLMFEPFTVSFQVDAQFQNWLEIFNWMKGLTSPTGDASVYDQMTANKSPNPFGRYSDIDLFILDSQRNPTLIFTFFNAIPVSLEGLQFDTTVSGTVYISSSVTFKYINYDVRLP